jgi:hypothetical protein
MKPVAKKSNRDMLEENQEARGFKSHPRRFPTKPLYCGVLVI